MCHPNSHKVMIGLERRKPLKRVGSCFHLYSQVLFMVSEQKYVPDTRKVCHPKIPQSDDWFAGMEAPNNLVLLFSHASRNTFNSLLIG